MQKVEPKKEILAIDFDGVVHDHVARLEGRRMGPPVEGARKAVKILKLQRDYKIIIFTVWGGSEMGRKVIGDWLNFYGIPYDEITNIKPNAKFYIDDKAIRFSSWQETLDFIKRA